MSETLKEIIENMPKDILIKSFETVYEDSIKKDLEIERLNKKIEQYKNPEDMTLMFMWCDEKAKDEIKRLNNIINELEKWLGSKTPYFRENDYDIGQWNGYVDCMNKIKELKGVDKE